MDSGRETPGVDLPRREPRFQLNQRFGGPQVPGDLQVRARSWQQGAIHVEDMQGRHRK